MRMNWWKWHQWLALVVGLQVLAWAASGLFMSAVPIERVRGEQLRRDAPPPDLAPWLGRVVLPATAGSLETLELTLVEGRPVWLAKRDDRPVRRIDALTGQWLPTIDAATARRIAAADYGGAGAIAGVREVHDHPPIEYRGPLPVWQVQFDDADGLRLYVSPFSGKVVARRTGTWRVYDFLWSLHIMDYRERENFNHPLLIGFAAGLLLLVGSGAVLLWKRFGARWGWRGTASTAKRAPPALLALLTLPLLAIAPDAEAFGSHLNTFLVQSFY